MDEAQARMTSEEYRGTEYLALISPWMDCVKYWEKVLEVDEAERVGRMTGESNLLAMPRPAAQHQLC